MLPELPRTVWSHILGHLTYKQVCQVARSCQLWNQELQKRMVVDLRDCQHIFAARRRICSQRHGVNDLQLMVPATHAAQRILGEVQWGYEAVLLFGLGVSLENLATTLTWGLLTLRGLKRLELYNMAFTDYDQGGEIEDWYTFDVGLLDIAELEILVLHFDRIADPCQDFHHIQGGWIRGLENCNASKVTLVSECCRPLRVRIPHPVVMFHAITDDRLYLERPKGDIYPAENGIYEGNYVDEGDAAEIHDLCILAAQTPQAIIPNTRTRRVFNSSNVDDKLSSLRTCITGNASSDQHYTATLNKWAASYSNLANANDTLPVSWYVSGSRWQKRSPFEPW
jgi:hypothetical protein